MHAQVGGLSFISKEMVAAFDSMIPCIWQRETGSIALNGKLGHHEQFEHNVDSNKVKT